MNVLLLTTDQQRADTLGAYGAGLGATPHLDRLAGEGAVFTEARCQHPYCQPSRWTILTGQNPRTHGVWTNGVDPTPAQVADALSTRASAAGVRTMFVGKAHLATNGVLRRASSPYMEALANAVAMPDDWHGPYMGFDDVALVQLGHFPFGYGPAPLGLHYGRWLARGDRWTGVRRFLQASPMMGLRPRPDAPQTWRSALPEELHPTTWVADEAIARIRAAGTRPFFLWASFPDPHHPMDAPAPWCDRYAPGDVPLPSRDLAELADKPPLQARFSRGLGRFAAALNTPCARLTDRQLATLIAAYYGMVAMADHHIGRVLAALEESGRARDTLVVFTSDHGELLGDHGLLFKGPFHYDGLLRVPLVLRGPGIAPGVRSDAPVGTVDLAPTIERFLGVARGPRVEGGDLAAVLSGREARDAVVTENDHRLGFREHVRTLTTREHKLNVHVGRDYGELYDRREDPGEHANRWRDRASLRRALEARLDELLPPGGERRAPVGLFPA